MVKYHQLKYTYSSILQWLLFPLAHTTVLNHPVSKGNIFGGTFQSQLSLPTPKLGACLNTSVVKSWIGTNTARELRILQNPFLPLSDIEAVWGNRVITGHVNPAPALWSNKVIPMVLSLAQWRSAEQLGYTDSWEPPPVSRRPQMFLPLPFPL